VAVAPEPVKQDLIDNEILESVPKTMKAKVQLLLKKMKGSPDISLNEIRLPTGLLFLVWFASSYPRCP
jgi:hypothetical protein